MKTVVLLSLVSLLFAQCRPKEPTFELTEFPGKPGVPTSIKNDHENLLQKIRECSLFQDSTGALAKKLSGLMQNHFQEEEDYVLPPLGLLPSLSLGNLPSEKKDIMMLIRKFKSQAAHMSAEHQLIKALMDELKVAAEKDNHPEVHLLAGELVQHATMEEEVLYPAVILIGRYLERTDSVDHRAMP